MAIRLGPVCKPELSCLYEYVTPIYSNPRSLRLLGAGCTSTRIPSELTVKSKARQLSPKQQPELFEPDAPLPVPAFASELQLPVEQIFSWLKVR